MSEIINVPEQVIMDAYSADVICYHSKIRKPFEYQGRLFVTTSTMSSGREGFISAEIVEVVEAALFEGQVRTYQEVIGAGYHSIAVKYQGKPYVMKGPTIPVTAAKDGQLNMFFEVAA